MTSKKNETPLFGYQGQPVLVTLDDGSTLSAGDVVARGVAAFADSHGSMADDVVPELWNGLPDDDRRDWCAFAIKEANEAIAQGTKQADVTATLDVSGKLAEKLLGEELIDAALAEIKQLPRPWQSMSAVQQDDVLERLTSRVRDAVGDAIRMLATKGAAHITCELEAISIKKGAKGTIIINKADLDQDLLDAVGQPVILVIGPELEVAKNIPKPAADPDQRDLLDAAGSTAVHSDPED